MKPTAHCVASSDCLPRHPVVVNELGPVTEAQIARLYRVMEAYLKGVGREDFVPSPGIQCVACEFFNECRAWR